MMIKENYIFLKEGLNSKEEVIRFIGEQAVALGISTEQAGLIADIEKREEEFSTDLGVGLAIPHAKSEYVLTPTIFFIRLSEEIFWSADSKVKGAIAFLVPKENADNIHLQMLSKVSRQLIYEETRNFLLKQGNQKEIFDRFCQWLSN